MSGKNTYEDISRKAIADLDTALNTPGQQGSGKTAYVKLSRKALDDLDATSGAGTSLSGYTEQPDDADGAPTYSRYQAGRSRG